MSDVEMLLVSTNEFKEMQTQNKIVQEIFQSLTNNKVRLSFYGDGKTFELHIKTKPELEIIRNAIYSVLLGRLQTLRAEIKKTCEIVAATNEKDIA